MLPSPLISARFSCSLAACLAGSAREHLHRWIAAAATVQRAVRAWLLRRGLARFAEARRRGAAAVVRLQALWRGRAARRQYQRQRQAAICFQVRGAGRAARVLT
jgi:aspartate aminotransferase-like enzyme